jgi:hypothetical protein
VPKMTEEQRQHRALMRARREALAAEEDDRRLEQRRQQWCNDSTYLSRTEMEAGEPCRGCGEPLLDGLGNWPPLMQMTPAQQSEYEQADVLFRERHRECRSHRWSMNGHRATHCGYCCPPPPLSERQIEQISRIFSSAKTEKKDLDGWNLTLTCDHVVPHTHHRDHDRYTTRVVDCPPCGSRRGVVRAQRVGPADDPGGRIQKERQTAELQSAKAKLERQRKDIAATELRIGEVAKQLEKSGP